MKSIGSFFALALLIGLLGMLGYGLVAGWGVISSQLAEVDAACKPLLLLMAAIVIGCTFLSVLLITSSVKKAVFVAPGKSAAYSAFLRWYIDADSNEFDSVDVQAIEQLRPEFLLWAGHQVIRQFNKLHDELQRDEIDSEAVKTKSRHVYIEIQRELGRRGGDAARQI